MTRGMWAMLDSGLCIVHVETDKRPRRAAGAPPPVPKPPLRLPKSYSNKILRACGPGDDTSRKAILGPLLYNTVEHRAGLLRFGLWRGNRPQSADRSLQNILAPNLRVHLPPQLFRSGRARSYSGFFSYAA